ncbi:MAG: radical SAM protein [Candidatus Bathyarchaeia archaeon]
MPFIPELNVIKKDWRRADLKIALCYPNVYRAGMSGLTVRLLYALLNVREDMLCERFFIPTLNEPLKSLESGLPLKKFDVVAFTLQYEEDYTNAIWMLFKSGIPPKRKNRKTDDPLVIAGGPCATANPEPLAEYVDLFVIGEAEPILFSLIDRIKTYKKPLRHIDEFANVKGVYVPQISNPTERIWIKNLNDAPHPLAQQIPLVDQRSPYMTIFGKAFAVEVVRGCSRCCRFCLIRNISQPKRERTLAKIEAIVEEGIKYTPINKISLIGASVFDHSNLEDICEFIVSQRLEIAVPSIRPESVTERLANLLAKGGQRNVSLAPDAASPRMWNIANKQMNEEVIMDAAKILLHSHINRLKLYFVIGLPGETSDDIEAIVDLSKKIADLEYGSKTIHLSINPLIPKPHTPFQWEKTPSATYIRKTLNFIKKRLKRDGRFMISSLHPRRVLIQSFLSLGDRKIGRVIELAARYGSGLGGWRKAFKECGVLLEKYIYEKSVDEPLPWDKINVGSNRQYLLKEVEFYRKICAG